MNNFTSCDAAYLAGLVDADGTITLTRIHRNEYRHAAVSISNTDRHLLDFVLTTVGAGKITAKRTTSRNHSRSFVYSIYNRQALGLLERVCPYLKTYKKKRAELLLSHYVAVTPRNGWYSKSMRNERLAFERRLLGIRAPRTD